MKRCWIEINLDTFADNLRQIKSSLKRSTNIILVVKADAYGHGAVPIALCAAKHGVSWFAVAYLEEALQVRAALPKANIIVIGVVDPREAKVLADKRIIPIVVDLEHGKELAAAARRAGVKLDVHVKIDTGMGRLGIVWRDAVHEMEQLLREEGLNISGICSHFAMVESEDPQAARNQAERFMRIAKAVEKTAGIHLFKHISSSRALLYQKDWDFDGVRPGIIAYGYGTNEDGMRARTQPILQWKGYVMQVKHVPPDFAVGYYSTYVTSRHTDLAVLGCGYADGYLRALSNRGHVLIRGQRCSVVGRVSMNWIMADLGPDSGIQRGDEVVFIGAQGRESVWANELAAICRTIPYEILTCIDSRMERRYLNGQSDRAISN